MQRPRDATRAGGSEGVARRLRPWGGAELRRADGGLELRALGPRPPSFDRVVAAHRTSHPRLPRVRDEGVRLWFDVDAACDLEAIFAMVEETGALRLPYQAALSLGDDLADLLEALHADGHFQGTLSWASVVVTGTGGWSFIAGAVPPGLGGQTAPEVLTGATPTAAADVFAVMSLLERLRHVAVIPEPQLRVLAGQPRPDEAEYAAAFVETHLRGLSVAPAARIATIAAVRAAHHRLWRYTGHRPDPDALERFLAQACRTMDRRRVLRVGPGCAWLELPTAQRVDLSRARSLRLIVAHLVDRHGDRDHHCSLAELAAAGWPGERIAREAARNRTHVALSKLRQRGLRELLETNEAGWRLARDVVVEQIEA